MSKAIEVLHELQKNLKAPKSQFNKFGGYHYRSCEDILEAVKPLLPPGCVITLTDEICPLVTGEGIQNRIYVKATATLICDEDEPFEVSAYARESFDKKGMDESQITGSASSYARKYALNGLLALSDVADADSTNKHDTAPEADLKGTPVKEKPAKAESSPSDMKADERSQILDGSYQMPFGRNKGIALMDIPTSEIEGIISYMEDKLVPGKWYKANAAKIEAFKQYLDKRVNSEAAGD